MLEIIKIIVLACQVNHVKTTGLVAYEDSLEPQRKCQQKILKCYQTNKLDGIAPSKVLADCLAKGKK